MARHNTMEPHLAQLLQSNEAPSQRMVAEIKQILQKPLNKFRANQLEIERLGQALQALNSEQERTRDIVKPYNTILSPIRRLPADVLHEIFFHCLPSHRFPIMDASEAPLLLTHICSSWRTIALSSPRLWAQIIISLPSQPYSYDDEEDEDESRDDNQDEADKPEIQEYKRVAALRAEVTKIWLDRSGDCLLSISVICPHTRYRCWNESMAKIVDNIVLHSRRWQSIELAVQHALYKKIEEFISNTRLSSLKAFKLKIEVPFTNRTFARGPPEPPSLLFLQTLKLDTLSLSWKKYTNDFNTIPIAWNQLRRLFLHSPTANTQIIPLLSKCPNLSECRLWIARPDRGPGAIVPKTSPQTVSLPHLQSFIVHDTTISPVTTAAYKAIHAPALRTVGYTRSYQGSVDRHGSITEGLTTQLSSFCDLLEAASIDNFMLALAYQPSKTVLDVLKKVPRPRHIIIGQKPLPFCQAESTGSPRYLDTVHAQSLPDVNQFNLRSLVVTDDLPSTAYMLPNLEILEAYGISYFSDDDALKLIKSRISASKAGHISGLKTVKLHFNRPMERDIKQEIHQYAHEVGVSPVKLELVYLKVNKRPTHMIPQSSSYGLSKIEGLSWTGAVEYDEFKQSDQDDFSHPS